MSRPVTARRATTVAPRHPRRVSGPAHPVRRPVPVPAPRREQQRTTGAIQAVTDHRLLGLLLRSRAWIWILAIGLGGIVTMQVSLLKLNTGISRAVQSAATLERQNAELEVQVARLSSDERIQAAAGKLGMVSQDASAVRFLRARGESDATRAARRMTPPSAEAVALTRARGLVAPGTLTATTTTTAPVPAVTPQPAATATPAAAPTATPAAAPTAATAGVQTTP